MRSRTAVAFLTISEFWGSLGLQVIYFIVPLLAVQMLDASALEIGILNMTEALAALLFGLGIGNLSDRYGGASSITLANVIRVAACLVLVSSLVYTPSMLILCFTMFLIGIASLMNEAGTAIAIVEHVGRSGRELNKANSWLRASEVISGLGGPGLGGLILAVSSFATSALLGAGSFAVAAGCSYVVWAVNRRRRAAKNIALARASDPVSAVFSLAGIRYIWRNAFLRYLVGSSLHFNFFSAGFQAVFIIYCVRVLGFEVWELSVIGIVAGVGGLLGAALASSRLVGDFPKISYALGLVAPAVCVAAIVAAQLFEGALFAVVVVAVAEGCFSMCMVILVVLFNTARQLVTPEGILGQVAASERMIAIGGEVPGALVGGVIGTFLSVQYGLWYAAAGMLLAVVWLYPVHQWPHDGAAELQEGDVGHQPVAPGL